MINPTKRSDILVFNCYLCLVRFLLACYFRSTKIGEISDISKCFENFVSQTLGVLTRIYAAELREGKTIIIIAHRLSTIKASEQIIVLESGKVVEQGSHEQLLSNKGAYHKLWKEQFEYSN